MSILNPILAFCVSWTKLATWNADRHRSANSRLSALFVEIGHRFSPGRFTDVGVGVYYC